MKNKERIQEEFNKLVEEGKLDPDDTISTKSNWKKLGYKVKENEEPIAIIPIHFFDGKKGFVQKSYFFSNKQVEPIKEKFS